MTEKSFAAKYKQLEEIIEWFESEEFDLDKAEAKLEEGMVLVKELQARLKATKLKIEKL